MCTQVLNRLHILEHKAAVAILETLMIDTPLSLFQVGSQTAKIANLTTRVAAEADVDRKAAIVAAGKDHANNCTIDQIAPGLSHVVTKLLPRRALARVKCYLR